jgi:TPR repeat protein
MNNLAICYQNGDGVERNMEKAFELYSKAFVCGSVDAGFNSAVCTENGWGT